MHQEVRGLSIYQLVEVHTRCYSSLENGNEFLTNNGGTLDPTTVADLSPLDIISVYFEYDFTG